MKKIAIFSIGFVSAIAHAATAAVPDIGELSVRGSISTSTCLLQSTNASSGKTSSGPTVVSYGNIPLSETNPGNSAWFVGNPARPITVSFSLKDANGSSPCNLSGGKWDISMNINLSTSTYRISNASYFGNDVIEFFAGTNIALLMSSTINGNTNGHNLKLHPANVSSTWGILMAGTNAPILDNTDSVALTMALFRNCTNGDCTIFPGGFGLTIPLTVVYK